MNKLTPLAAVISVAMLYGCAAPSDIKPTNQLNDKSVLEHSKSLASTDLSAATWPQSDWWTVLSDTQLNELIQRALKNSPTLQLANANLNKASAAVMAADAQFDPQLAANAGATRSRLSRSEDYSYQGNQYGTVYNLGLSGSYNVDLWGGERDAWEASVDAQRAAQVDHQAARISLSSGIASTYIQLANAYRLLDIAQQDQERTQGIVTITQRLLDNGLTSEDRLYTAQSNAATSQQTVKQRLLAIKQLKNALATMVGEGPDLANTIERPSALLNTALTLPTELPANLLAHRPDIVAAKWRVEAASKNIASAKTKFYPNLNLSAMAGFRAVLGDAMFEDVSRQWRVAPAISLPIFTRDLKANLIENTADYDAAVAQYNQTLVNALGDVADTVLALKSAEQQLNDAKESVRLATKSYHITEKRYQSGMGSQLEVLMAESQLLQAESALTTLQNQQQEKQVTLVNVLGGGFYDAQANPSQQNDQATTTK
ncbi:efflux transporter outer membrane subunit [Vibrio porteresiae]|uniref:Efflux transporter outer membrane subunit n=1 Tax=Vibrio porteresiae DSM 19223 TaxID=1123496 RepID=A0ABZ0QI24_9VIBR|nr:efflux transporter outer membrane subunit [Vibrio porteresiae]WPC75696.1 efflux transporter outer membrane subunit [Vibrio porteresiae DSM 19223]